MNFNKTKALLYINFRFLIEKKNLKQLERNRKNIYIKIMVETTEDKKKYKLTHKQVDKTVDSPCIQICTYDEEEEFCIGCYRTKQELQDWWIMTREQKLEALKKLEGGYED